MIPNPEFDAVQAADPRLSNLAGLAAKLGYEIVDIAGFLDSVDEQSKAQLVVLEKVQNSAGNVLTANTAVRSALDTVSDVSETTLKKVEGSVEFVRDSGLKSHSVAKWVKELTERMERVASSLEGVEANNKNIADIAKQVNILAINAKIEAARAGEFGRGFGVVAEAINELSQKTARAAEEIEENIHTLSSWVGTLREEATVVSEDASVVLNSTGETDRALMDIAGGVEKTVNATRVMSTEAEKVREAVADFEPAFDSIRTSSSLTADGIHQSRKRVNSLIDSSEGIYSTTVDLGGASEDIAIINKVKSLAGEVGQAFTDAVFNGKITKAQLFTYDLREIPGTNPTQHMAPFTDFADSILPRFQEPMLEYSDKIVFCVAIAPNGYLPTHNKIFSKPQGNDADWNAANSRNRRVFDDRVGLKAGRNKEPFLLQVYRRDMGGGNFVMMKDLSCPIIVDGDHWGGLRVGYRF